MHFETVLQQGRLLRRYKRFLVDVLLDDGSVLTMHCPNTGSMKNCCPEDARVWFSTSDNPKRKYAHTWELLETPDGEFIGINTHRANTLVEEALREGRLHELAGFDELLREKPYGQESSRIDILLKYKGAPDTYIEVKSVTLLEDDGWGYFPDAVSLRGQKHLRELIALARSGERAVLLFCVQHTGILRMRPAAHIDPDYAALLREAAEYGVEVLAYGVDGTPVAISLERPVLFELYE